MKKIKRKTISKLNLKKETVLVLNQNHLKNILGGKNGDDVIFTLTVSSDATSK